MRRALRIAALLLGAAAPVRAEPYIAVREGLRCSACHVNMTGGGKRTDLVNTHARDLLHYPAAFGSFSTPADFFTGELDKYAAIGADLRASGSAVFQNRGVGGRVDNNEVFRGRLEHTTLDVTEMVVYGELRLIPDALTLYVDQRVSPSTDNREAFGMVHSVLPWNGYLKVGRMFLPYGLQLQDDDAFIRSPRNRPNTFGTGFTFNKSDGALEIGLAPGPLTLIAAVSKSQGSTDRDFRITTTASLWLTRLPVIRTLLLGNSFSRVGPPGSETVLFGFFAGSTLGRFTYLGEADFRSDRTPDTGGRSVGSFAGYAEGDYLLFGWLNLKGAFDYSDSAGNLAQRGDDSENRVSVGLEPFLNRFLQPRLFYRVSNGIKNEPTHNQNVLFGEVHVFF